jgi:hypothetical protein
MSPTLAAAAMAQPALAPAPSSLAPAQRNFETAGETAPYAPLLMGTVPGATSIRGNFVRCHPLALDALRGA